METARKPIMSGVLMLAWMALPVIAVVAFGGGAKIREISDYPQAKAALHADKTGTAIFGAFYACWTLWSFWRVLRRYTSQATRLAA